MTLVTLDKRFPWATTLEGREVTWEGRRWRFVQGAPRDIGIAEPEAGERERWASISDACRMHELRTEFIRAMVRAGKVRARRFMGNGSRGSPVVYVALEDVARLHTSGRGPKRTKSVRAQAVVGPVMFIAGEPVADRMR